MPRPGGAMHPAMSERGRLGAHPGTGPTPGVHPPTPIRTVEKEWRDRVRFPIVFIYPTTLLKLVIFNRLYLAQLFSLNTNTNTH